MGFLKFFRRQPIRRRARKTGVRRGVPFSEALYHSVCGACREPLEWQAHFDADGTSYTATCNCGMMYNMTPSTVDISFE